MTTPTAMRTITAYGKEQLTELNDAFKENMRIMESLEESINIRQLVTKTTCSIQANAGDIQASATNANIDRNMERDKLITTRQHLIANISTITDNQVIHLKAQLEETASTVMYNFNAEVT